MSAKRDYYEVLGVDRSSSADEIKRAYRRLAKKYHPDRNPGNPASEAKFKEVQHAYDILNDAGKRKQYDDYGEVGVGQWETGSRGERVYQWGGSKVGADDLEELLSSLGGGRRPGFFEEIFGGAFGGGGNGRRRARPPMRVPDQEQEVSISFEQAVRGTPLNLSLNTAAGVQNIEVKVPPGVEDGQKLRLRGRIPAPPGGQPGDLILVCRIQPHAYYTRRGTHLYVDVPVTPAEAALGGKIEVPSLDGLTIMTLPPSTASGSKMRLKGRGLQKAGTGPRGDLYVVIKIVPPTSLTKEQRDLYAALAALDVNHPRKSCPWFSGASI